jgi:hypothetical protein
MSSTAGESMADEQGHCVLEMPSGTGKTVSLLSLIVSYMQVRSLALYQGERRADGSFIRQNVNSYIVPEQFPRLRKH